MTLDPVSLALGFVAAYVFSGVALVVMYVVDWRQAKKQRDDALDNLLAEVGIACIEQPTNVRTN